MPKDKRAAYLVSVTAVRDYDPSAGPPPKSHRWQFSQQVWSNDGYAGALSALVDKFFDLYPDQAILLPQGKRGQRVLTRGDRSGLGSVLGGHSFGDVFLESVDAVLKIDKMRALSGDTPTKLTPSSDKEYSERLQNNVESVKWWQDPIVQVPSPLYVQKFSSAPSAVRYKGNLYRKVAISVDPTEQELEDELSDPIELLRAEFSEHMGSVITELGDVINSFLQAGDYLQNNDPEFQLLIRRAGHKLFNTVIKKHLYPALTVADELAARLSAEKQ